MWVTEMERRELERARRRGYLVMRERDKFLELAWRRWCQEQCEPCIRVVKGEGSASVTLSLATTTAEFNFTDIEAIRRYLKPILETGVSAPGNVLPIVYRGGTYTQSMSRPRAEQAAQFLLQTARACRSRQSRAQ